MPAPLELPPGFSRYDAAEFLKTEDDIAHYLEAVFDEAGDDPGLIAEALGAVARSRNMSQLSREVGITRQGLAKALSADGNPSFGTVLKVIHALGLQIHIGKAA